MTLRSHMIVRYELIEILKIMLKHKSNSKSTLKQINASRIIFRFYRYFCNNGVSPVCTRVLILITFPAELDSSS